MKVSNKLVILSVLSFVISSSCTLSAPNAKIDANVDQSTQKGTSSNTSDGKSGAGSTQPQQIVVNVNNNPNINTNVNPNISNSSSNTSTTNNNNANNQNNNVTPSSNPSPSASGTIGSGTDEVSNKPKYKILFKLRDNISKNPIYISNIDGALKTRLFQGESEQHNSFPVGSPNGSKIAFNSAYNLYIMNSDGTSNIPITKGEFYGITGMPSWSSDSKKIYYQDQKTIYSINSDGTEKNIVYKPEQTFYFSRISPDNKTLAYISYSKDSPVLTIVGVNGIGETQITDTTKILLSTNSNICWSLDGKSIIFSGYIKNKEDNTDIYQINIDGTELRKLTDNVGVDTYPSLSSDGKMIVFKSKREEGQGIYTMTSDGKNQQLVINDNDAEEPSFILISK